MVQYIWNVTIKNKIYINFVLSLKYTTYIFFYDVFQQIDFLLIVFIFVL